MTTRTGVRLLIRTLTGVVMLVSGGYLMVYLYRWEWNRALISGMFFLAAEMAAITSLLFARLARLERRFDDGPPAQAVAAPAPAAEVHKESPFAWLHPAGGRMGVFVPILMGAGVIVSAIAFVVEKLSSALARSAAAERPAVTVGPPLPTGGLLAGPPPAPPAAPGRAPRSSLTGRLALFVAGVLAFPAVGLVADATQSRPDPHPDRTTIEVNVRVRETGDDPTQRASALWVACQGRIRLDHVDVVATGPAQARLVVSGVMGEHARRKFVGCLEDATLDGVRATVVAMSAQPTAPEPEE
jgi:hypothetical protein